MKNISDLLLKGGIGSGNFGHSGRPGQVGGSGSGGSGSLHEEGSNPQDSFRDRFNNNDDIAKSFKKIGLVKSDGDVSVLYAFHTKEEQKIAQKAIEESFLHIKNNIPSVSDFLKKKPLDSIDVANDKSILGIVKSYPDVFGKDTLRYMMTTGCYAEANTLNLSKNKVMQSKKMILSAGIYLNWDEAPVENYLLGIPDSLSVGYTIDGGRSARTIFRHELGHHVYNMQVKTFNKRQKLSSLWYQHLEKNKITPQIIKKQISQYAGANGSECFSECFSLYAHPDYKSGKNRLPREIESFFDEHLPYSNKKSLSWYIVKHLQGQHDQLSHGRRGSNVSESRNPKKPTDNIFHGTSVAAAKKIVKEGLKLDKADFSGVQEIFATVDFRKAAKYSAYRYDYNPKSNRLTAIIFVDKNWFHKSSYHKKTDGVFTSKFDVPLSAIVKAEVYKVKDLYDFIRSGKKIKPISVLRNEIKKSADSFIFLSLGMKDEKIKSLSELLVKYIIKGGPGSGNFGHSGRPGQVGGSSNAGGSGSLNERSNPKIMWADDEWSKKFSKIGIIGGKSSFLSLKEFASNEEKAKACTSIFETHKNLIENFPVLKNLTGKTPVRYLYIMGTEDIAGEMGGEKKGVGGRYSEESDQIMISRGDRSKSWEQGNLTIGDGNVDYSAPGIYRHEFAHHLYANFRDLGFPFGSRSDFAIPFSKMTPVEVSRKISRYATTNAEEGFCESFSAYTHPDYGKKNKLLPKEIHDFFIKYFPKKKSKAKSLSEYLIEVKGGQGSGNFGHAGRPGVVGGSGSGSVGSINEGKNPLDALRQDKNPIIQDLVRNLDSIEESSRMWMEDKKKWMKKFKSIGLIEKEKGELNFQGFENSPDIATSKYISEVIEKNLAANIIYDTHKNIIDSIPEVKLFIKSHPITSLNLSGEDSIQPYKKILGSVSCQSATGIYSFPSDLAEQGFGSKGDIFISHGTESSWKNRDRSLIFGDIVLNNTPRSIYRHELGHHIYESMDRDPKWRIKAIDFRETLGELDNSPGKNIIKKTISIYAATDTHEAFAECFSAYTHPDYGKRKGIDNRQVLLPKEIHDYFITNFPKKKSKEKSLSEYLIKGGAGSGNFGHAGRPGQVGGSAGDNIGSLHESRRNRLREVIDNTVQSLKDPSSNPNIKLWSEARDEIYSFAKSAEGRKRESVILSVRGENIRIEGERSRTEIPMPILRKSEYTIHNHPGSSPPSSKDLVTFMDCPNMKVMEIITSDGTVHRLTKDSNNPNIRKKWIASEFEKIEEERYPDYDKKVNNSKSILDKTWQQEASEVVKILSKKLGIKYEVKNISNIKFMVNMKKARVYTIQEGDQIYLLDDSEDERDRWKEYLERQKKKVKSLSEYLIEIKGGQGSGNFGHSGRPGQVGGSSDTGTGSLHESISSELKKQIEGIFKTDHALNVMEVFEVNHSLPNDKVIKTIEDQLKEDLKKTVVCKRVHLNNLDDILNDERIKSQFETGRSDGSYNPSGRSKVEKNVLNNKNFDRENSPEEATIYGYLSKKPGEVSDAGVSHYGGNTIVFKKDIRQRTTFTDDDSLENYHSPRSIPSLVDRPSIFSISRIGYKDENEEPINFIKGGFAVGGSRYDYYEAQIHGKVKVSDIKKVYLEKVPDYEIEFQKKVIQKIENLGIEWEYMKNVKARP